MGYVTDYFSDIESPVDGINEKRVIDSILEKKKNNYTLSKIEERILTQYFEFSIADIGVKSFFGSYCTLGSKKVFVHVNGDFFGCEKTSDSFKIGSIHDGFDLDRIMEIEEEWIEKTVMCNGFILQGNCHACVGCCGVENKLEFEDYCKKKRELFLHRIKDYIEFRKLK